MAWFGSVFIVALESIISCIFSALIYYNVIEGYKYYFMAFSISSVEYIKLLVINVISENNDGQLFSNTSFISVFLTIFNAILTLIENLVTDHIDLFFFQFIFATILSAIGICFSLYFICINKFLEIYEEVQKFEEEEKKLIEELEKKKKEKERYEALMRYVEKLKKENGEYEEDENDNW